MPENKARKIQQLERTRECRAAFTEYSSQPGNEAAKLMLAAGETGKDGWFCTDITPAPDKGVYYCNMVEKFPFDGDSFDYVHCEHGIEHIDLEGGLKCLSECHRVLKEGGVLRLATPSLDNWVKFYLDNKDENDNHTIFATHFWLPTAREIGLYSKCLVFNNAMRNWGHKLIYDYETLSRILIGLKFREVVRTEIGVSHHPELQNAERHFAGEHLTAYNKMEVMVLEATK